MSRRRPEEGGLRPSRRVLVLNGPNLGRLGRRQPEIYGYTSYDELADLCVGWGRDLELEVEVRQTNHEGELLDWLNEAADSATPVVLNAVGAALTRALSPSSRTLARPLTTGDLVLASHAVPGVVAVRVTRPRADVPAAQARISGGVPRPARLVVLAPGGLTVTEASS